MLPAIIFGIFFGLAFMSDDAKGLFLSATMSGLALGCIYLIILAALIIFSVPAIIFFLGHPQLMLPVAIAMIVIIMFFWVIGD